MGFNITSPHAVIGWGTPLFVNTGCNIEDFGTGVRTSASGCTGNCQLIRQATVDFWDNMYKDFFRRLPDGLQYSFTQKYGFGRVAGSPERNENMFLASLRYYPF